MTETWKKLKKIKLNHAFQTEMFKDKNEIHPSPWKSPFALSQRVWTTIRCTVTKSLNSNQMQCNKEFEQQPDAL